MSCPAQRPPMTPPNMSYDLESSKRRLSRLLNAISETPRGKSAARTASNGPEASADSLPPPKRVKRLSGRDQFGGLAGALIRNGSASSLRLANTRQPPTAGPAAILAKDKVTKTSAGDGVAPFNPSSRQDFLFRLRTFSYPSPLNWTTKPDAINEVQWARRGWTCCGREEVVCLCCRESFKVVFAELELQSEAPDEDLLEDERQDLLKGAVDKIAQNMTEAHRSSCPWLSKMCDDTIYRLPVNHSYQALIECKTRYNSLLELHDLLPPIETPSCFNNASSDLLSDLTTAAEHYFQLERSTSLAQQPLGNSIEDGTRQAAFCMALFGFVGNERSQYASATCHACWRRVGFWLYRYDPEASPTERPGLDPAEAHREYCPWVNSETQNAGILSVHRGYPAKSLSGWETLLVKFTDLKDRDPESYSAKPSRSSRDKDQGERTPDDDESAHRERLSKWQHLKERLSAKGKKTVT